VGQLRMTCWGTYQPNRQVGGKPILLRKQMIHYLEGDATEPVGDGNKIIAHVCNDAGGWGAGFVTAISKKWDEPERAYRSWYRGQYKAQIDLFALGNIQLINVVQSGFAEREWLGDPIERTSGIWVANMIGQVGYGSSNRLQHRESDQDQYQPPIRYEAVESCLNKLNVYLIKLDATMHAPRFGCGLAGGSWEEIEKLIQKCITKDVFIYDYNKDDSIPWRK